LYKDSIYAEINDRIVRYSLSGGAIVPSGSADTIVSGLPLTGDIRCIPSSSKPKDRCTWTWLPRRILAS
jgi:hypothetical protein